MHPPIPFNARAARTLREKLGMAPGHVAYGMSASYGMTHITPDHITAWERGVAAPTAHELNALAGALWCAPSELMDRPRTLHEHRLARGIAADDVADATGMSREAYQQMEASGVWRGDTGQSARLGDILGLEPRDLVAVTGREGELARLLTEAVSTRWQAHFKEIAKLLSMDKRDLKEPLRAMHDEYQTLMAATLMRASANTAAGEAGQSYVENIVDHFWERLGA
ncbi:helix-turn-helix domain-containing protein [Streptomyces sp. Da 82-17]|uniref:helix-turn-helix domain-containing protein n=1 Tax=Streptomyces sp. Da 82-17 TaxID=3377116 RepID=UPI0038D4DE9F